MVDERPADAPDLPDSLEDDTSLRAELGANAPSRIPALATCPNAHLYQLTACAVAKGFNPRAVGPAPAIATVPASATSLAAAQTL